MAVTSGPASGPASEEPAPSDAELLALHIAGEHEAFGELVRRHRDRLWAVALRTIGDREEAADALQDAMVAAFRAAHTFQGRSAVTTWLHRIVVNACLDRARRSAVRQTRPLEDEQSLDAAVEPAEGADVSAERSEVRHEVAAALALLPVDQRAALVLVDLQGYSVTEAAAVLSVPNGTVKSRCARGRARLLPLLAHLRANAVPPDAVSRETGAVSRETELPPRPPLHAVPQTAVSRETAPHGTERTTGRNHGGGPSVPPPQDHRRDARSTGGDTSA
jgi:RNA polymerase sigma-70 factor (ECF subfamily)